MGNIQTIEQAREYSEKIWNLRDFHEIDIFEVINSLSVLADLDDKENYKKVVDSFVELLRTIGGGKYELQRKLSRDPFGFLEFLLIGTDHGFAALGFGWDGKKLPVEKNQLYFNKLYGEHFYRS